MIKLIASDMDGTLLDDQKKIDREIYHLIPKMKEKNITFIVASGRQYPSLLHLFQEYKKDVVIVAENGAFVMQDEKELYSSCMKQELVKVCLDAIYEIGEAEPMVCAKHCSYTTNPRTYEGMRSDKFQYNMRLVDSLYEIEDEILKVSLLDNSKAGPEKHSFAKLSPLLKGKGEIAVSGFNCVDIVNKDVSKGAAIAAIQKQWGIKTEETMAFGDNYNDIEMLQQAHYSFAMENAEHGVKKYAKYIAQNNNVGGVVKEIRKYTGL